MLHVFSNVYFTQTLTHCIWLLHCSVSMGPAICSLTNTRSFSVMSYLSNEDCRSLTFIKWSNMSTEAFSCYEIQLVLIFSKFIYGALILETIFYLPLAAWSCLWYEQTIKHMREWPMTKVVTKSRHFDTKNIFISDVQPWLPWLQCLYKFSRQMTNPRNLYITCLLKYIN